LVSDKPEGGPTYIKAPFERSAFAEFLALPEAKIEHNSKHEISGVTYHDPGVTETEQLEDEELLEQAYQQLNEFRESLIKKRDTKVINRNEEYAISAFMVHEDRRLYRMARYQDGSEKIWYLWGLEPGKGELPVGFRQNEPTRVVTPLRVENIADDEVGTAVSPQWKNWKLWAGIAALVALLCLPFLPALIEKFQEPDIDYVASTPQTESEETNGDTAIGAQDNLATGAISNELTNARISGLPQNNEGSQETNLTNSNPVEITVAPTSLPIPLVEGSTELAPNRQNGPAETISEISGTAIGGRVSPESPSDLAGRSNNPQSLNSANPGLPTNGEGAPTTDAGITPRNGPTGSPNTTGTSRPNRLLNTQPGGTLANPAVPRSSVQDPAVGQIQEGVLVRASIAQIGIEQDKGSKFNFNGRTFTYPVKYVWEANAAPKFAHSKWENNEAIAPPLKNAALLPKAGAPHSVKFYLQIVDANGALVRSENLDVSYEVLK